VRGVGDLYEITPSKKSGQDKMRVNAEHILVLACNQQPKLHYCTHTMKWTVQWYELSSENKVSKRNWGDFSTRCDAEKFRDSLSKSPIIWEVSVLDYLNAPRHIQRITTMFKPDLIRFAAPVKGLASVLATVLQDNKINFAELVPNYLIQSFVHHTAWLLGLWLIDGVTQKEMSGWGSLIPVPTINPSKIFRRILQSYGLLSKKHLPLALSTECVEIRINLLAGIIDAAGHLRGSQSYQVCCKDLHFAEQLQHLAKSLGFRVGRPSMQKVVLSGNNIAELSHSIKTRWKKIKTIIPEKDSNCWSFTVSKLPRGDYYGFTVSGPNQRFLMKDLTVTHNTTLVHLLLRFYDAQTGTIRIDGRPLKQWDLKLLRRYISVVSQDTQLFADTVLANITYGLQPNEFSMDDVIEAAKAANAHDFICDMVDGYSTKLGERGVRISGGNQ
jgi:hypothetical protein